MASSSQISPVSFGGIPRTPGGLTDRTFLSSCPPAVQPNTHIIALCGIADRRGDDDEPYSYEESQDSKTGAMNKIIGKEKDLLTAADPSKAKRQERKEAKKLKAQPHGQASLKEDGWFLSDFYLFWHLFRDLETLVSRHGQYAHGEVASDHRVVLDKNMLADVKAAGNIQSASPKDLLQDFITHFKARCKTASEKKQPILLMVFGHGDEDTHGIAIGGEGKSKQCATAPI